MDVTKDLDEDGAELWEVVREGDRAAIEALLVGDEEHPPLGVSVDVRDGDWGMTALHWLTVEGHNSVAQWLIQEVGADVNAHDSKYGQTALHYAATKDRGRISEMLMQMGADPAARDSAGWTALHAAARSGAADAAAALLRVLPAEGVNACAAGGQTPLHRAAFWGRTEICALLLDHGADIKAADSQGRTAVELACDGDGRDQLPALQKLLSPAPPERA